ncbi:hypothetical protein S83_047649, partial [Arachis hypogaea]
AAVLAMDESVLDVDQVENLIKFCPTKEEMELLKGYTGDKENLGKCEQYFLELMKVPRVESKLRVFSFKIQFLSQVTEFKKSLKAVNSACEESFKLTDTRASNNKMTLMHYLCKVLADRSPELLDFHLDLVSLEAATTLLGVIPNHVLYVAATCSSSSWRSNNSRLTCVGEFNFLNVKRIGKLCGNSSDFGIVGGREFLSSC